MLNSSVDAIFAPFGELLAPARCHWCGAAVGGQPACPACRDALPWNACACRACALPLLSPQQGVCAACLTDAPPFDRAWTAFRYETPVRQQIVGLKFRGTLAPAHVLGRLMAERLARRAEPLPEVLIPVPLHAARLRRRGYNQALEFGRELSRRLSLPLAPRAAARTRPTREQTDLTAAERRRNLRGAFSVGDAVRGKHIALLDDVITTGATLGELARAARKAGARRIEAWAVARTA